MYKLCWEVDSKLQYCVYGKTAQSTIEKAKLKGYIKPSWWMFWDKSDRTPRKIT